MPRIRSANPDFLRENAPNNQPQYIHGVDRKRSFIPLAFQISSPYDYHRVLLPHALVMHVNPQTFSESFNKKTERFQTRGGFVEQHWGDELTELSADGVTGAFMNIYTGTSSILRQQTIAWDRFRDLYDLYRHNGSVYDPYGNIVLQGNVLVMYDRGIYAGAFRTFDVEETDDTPFMFHVSWSFKIEHTIYQAPFNVFGPGPVSPVFQQQNTSSATRMKPLASNKPPEIPDYLLDEKG